MIEPQNLIGKFIAYDGIDDEGSDSGALFFKVSNIFQKVDKSYWLVADNVIIRYGDEIRRISEPRCFSWETLKTKAKIFEPTEVNEKAADEIFLTMLAGDAKNPTAMELGAKEILKGIDFYEQKHL